MRKLLLLTAILFSSFGESASARDFIDCGSVDLMSIDSEKGRVLGSWSTPGLGVGAFPFLLSPDKKQVYVGFRTCHDGKGAVVKSGVLPPHDGKLVATAINLSVPDLKEIGMRYPNSDWASTWEPLPSSDADALTRFNKMLFFDKTESPPKLKLIDLQYKPEVHILEEPWKNALVRDFIIGQRHAFVFIEERTLYCYDISTGQLVWQWQHDGPKDEAGPGVEIQIYEDADRYYVSVNHAGLYALDVATGKRLWRVSFFNIYGPPPIIKAGNTLILGPATR